MRIKKITINDVQIHTENMVLIVGANGTGKTRLLDEIHSVFCIKKRQSNFWKISFEYDIKPNDKFVWYRNLHQFKDRGVMTWYCPFTKSDGRKLNNEEYKQFDNEGNLDFLKNELTHYLPVGNRLNIPSNTAMTPQTQAASDPLNLLFRSKKMFKEIKNNLNKLFNKKLHIAFHNIPHIELRLSENSDPDLPKWIPDKPQESFQKYESWLEKNNIGEITIEGHGIQAFLHIMLSYALPTNEILMIDEPEIHLYPSIKRKFGQILGELAQKDKRQFICVTHDSDFLQGVFDAKCNLDVIKLSKSNKERSIIHTKYKVNNSLWAKHNQSSFLQIAFLDCCILVEGVTDRLVYEHIFSDQKMLNNAEYKFISSGGKDSIPNPEKIAQDLKVPYAIILDIDILKEGEYENLKKLLKLKDQKELLKKINIISVKLKNVKNFKSEGMNAIQDMETKKQINDIITNLKEFGIFVVPYGCLESWYKINCLKAEFPEKIIKAYKRKKKNFIGMVRFLNEIGYYLNDQL